MAKTASTQSSSSLLSAESDVSGGSYLSVPPIPSPLGSGALTPALSDREADNPMSFADELLQRRRQSSGLETIVQWHEGRADLESVIREMIDAVAVSRGSASTATGGETVEVGTGGWLSVNACGPWSLLHSAREQVRALGSVKGAWKGDVVVDFHAETFGW